MDRSELQPIIEDRLGVGEEIPAQYTDSTKAIRLLGWSPRVEFAEGLRRTIAWYRDFARTRPGERPTELEQRGASLASVLP
jgi:nucleoside-diphosphate-sugar epimerase